MMTRVLSDNTEQCRNKLLLLTRQNSLPLKVPTINPVMKRFHSEPVRISPKIHTGSSLVNSLSQLSRLGQCGLISHEQRSYIKDLLLSGSNEKYLKGEQFLK